MGRRFTVNFALTFILILPSCKTVDRNHSEVLVTNGEHIKHTDFPHTIALYNQQGGHYCSATLIGPNAAITAAHCINGKSVPPFVIVGSNDYEPSKGVYVDTHNAFRDLAVLIFPNSPFTDTVRVAKEDPQVGAVGTIIGYGCDGIFADSGGKRTGKATVKAVEVNGEFSSIIADFKYNFISQNPGSASAACPGDSGGALIIDGILSGVTSTGGSERTQKSSWSSLESAGAKKVLNGFNTLGARIPGTEAGSTDNLIVYGYDQGAVERKEARTSVVQKLVGKRAEEDLSVGDRNEAQKNLVSRSRTQMQLREILPQRFEAKAPTICEIIGEHQTTNPQRRVAFSKTRIESSGGPSWLYELSEESLSGDLYLKLRRHCDAFFSTVSLLTRGNESIIRGTRQGDEQVVSQLLDDTDYDLVVRPMVVFSANPNLNNIGASISELAIEIASNKGVKRFKIDQ